MFTFIVGFFFKKKKKRENLVLRMFKKREW